MKIAIVAPHVFMQDKLLDRVIFSPGYLALDLSNTLIELGHDVTLFTPGEVTTKAKNQTADLTLFQEELDARGDDELALLKKHPLTFISLARQVQGELIAKAFQQANDNIFDLVHVYMNEEEQGLVFSSLCNKPVVFTHHDPFNFSTKYRSIMPKHANALWISMSLSQRAAMPANTNWIANIYHGLATDSFKPIKEPTKDYLLYIGRIIESKGVHLAIQAVRQYNQANDTKIKLKIAGKHYSGPKDDYWQKILPSIDGEEIEYVGFVNKNPAKNDLIANAAALILPSIFDEPFGIVMVEALACGTPIIGLDSGAIPEVVDNNRTGFVAHKVMDGKDVNETETVHNLAASIQKLPEIHRADCRADFENRFTLIRMAKDHANAYQSCLDIPRKMSD